MTHSFYAMTMPGLETVAFSEIRSLADDVELLKFARGIALFRTAVEPQELLDLHTTEDVFFMLAHVTGLSHGRDALKVLHSATLHTDSASALAMWRRTHYHTQPRTWRAVSQMVGNHAFRRIDAGQAVSDALRKILPHNMRQVKDDADVECWLWLSGSEALIGLRLSDAMMRHRVYKREHLPASLRPSVAASVAWLSQPSARDRILDPLCGAGTLIIERGMLASFDTMMGSDIRPAAVAMARRNAHAAAIEAAWRVLDARNLPLDSGSVTRILTNLPFGKQLGSHEENIALYTALSREFARVLSADGLAVTLTSEDLLWERILREDGWDILKKVVFVVLGQPATIFVTKGNYSIG